MTVSIRARTFGLRHAVVTGHHLATQAASRILDGGGTLVDAMVAASAVLTVALPHATSLGGCGMLLYFDAATGTLHGLNGSGRAPALATPDLFDGAIGPRGPRTWVTPGLVGLWGAAHARYGRRPWSSLFDDAVRAAEFGIGLSSEIARNLRGVKSEVASQPGFAALFQPRGTSLVEGERLVQPALAATMQHIAEAGVAGFYEGPVALALDACSREHGGLLRAADMTAQRADWVTPVRQVWAGREVAVMPPNSLGVLMLAQLDGLTPYLASTADARAHAQIQIARFCLDQYQARVADPAARWPVRTDPAELVACIGAPPRASSATDLHDPGDTAGIVLADAAGNALVMLQSVFQPFGSGCVDPRSGILMNNRMIEFDLEAGSPNRLAPGKRPTHTLNPYIVLRGGRPALLGVSPGGVSQTTTGVQVVCRSCIDGLPLTTAVDTPRWSVSRQGGILLEPGFSAAVAAQLRAQGVVVEENSRHDFYFGSAKLIRIGEDGLLEAAADLRRQASALAD